MSRKRGALSNEDKTFIRKNIEQMSVEDIANNINRSTGPVERFIAKEKIGPDYEAGKVQSNEDLSQNEIVRALRSRPFYRDLKIQLSVNEMRSFEESWVLFQVDLTDIMASEELDLKELILLDILKSRLFHESKIYSDDRNEARKLLNLEMKLNKEDRDKELIRQYKQTIADAANFLSSFNKDLKDLIDRTNKIKNSLQQTRTERTKDLDNAGVDYKGFLKMLQDKSYREKAAREQEILRKAQAKEQKKLAGLREFADGIVDRVILSSETVSHEEENNA